MGEARKWHFSTSGGVANLRGAFGDLSEHRGSGITLLGITSLLMHKLTGLPCFLSVLFLIKICKNVVFSVPELRVQSIVHILVNLALES